MKNNKYILLTLLFLGSTFPISAKIIFVNTNVSNGNDDGTSWGNAYSIIQPAINEAIYGDSIWIAEGTYKPTNGSFRQFSFVLKNGVKWFGGFQGNETELSQRDFTLYPTILSGDIGIQGDSTDNSYHVIYTIGTDSTSLIDGFTIQEGQAININLGNSPFSYGGGMFVDGNVDNIAAHPVIKNCHFKNNVALFGGGLAIGSPSNGFSLNPHIINCQFTNNYADSFGGAIIKLGGNPNAAPNIFESCLFKDNISFGGAIHLDMINEHHFVNCDFENNISFSSVHGSSITISSLFIMLFSEAVVAPIKITGCTFINSSDSPMIYIERSNLWGEEFIDLKISDTDFFNNSSIASPSIDFEGYYNLHFVISNCLFEGTNQVFGSSFKYGALNLDITGNIGVAIPNNNQIDIFNTIFSSHARAITIQQDETSVSTIKTNTNIYNCTFFKNRSAVLKKIFFISTNPESYNKVNIANSIFWQDQPIEELFIEESIVNNIPDSNFLDFSIHHSLLKTSNCLINGIDVCGDNMLYNIYPEFRDTMNNDFSLRSCSPAINQGDDLTIDTLGIIFDHEGNPRIIDNAVDLGAYETQDFEVLVPQVQHVKCFDGADGAITWVQHGTPPFTFEWNNGIDTGTVFTGLQVGEYSITVMDADSCTEVFSMTVNEPLPIEIIENTTPATGEMNADGIIEITPTGGSPSYQYLWSNGDTTATIQNLLPGFYTVTVTDINDCFEILEIEVDFLTTTKNIENNYSFRLIPTIIEQGNTSHLEFELNKNTVFEIEIFNELGQFIFYKKIEMGRGKNTFELPPINGQGLFFIKIKNTHGNSQIAKWVII